MNNSQTALNLTLSAINDDLDSLKGTVVSEDEIDLLKLAMGRLLTNLVKVVKDEQMREAA